MKLLKSISFILIILAFTSCDILTEVAGDVLTGESPLTSAEIGSGLKEALTLGISEGATQLAQKNGYFDSPYKILLPQEAQKVTDKLSKVPGFTQVEDVILEKINKGAEDAASKAKPIFVKAIKDMTFADATNILMGNNNAATQYLEKATSQELYNEFHPVIVTSLNKFNAIEYWEDAVTKYNKIPFVDKVNPKLDQHVTEQALVGLFSMVEKKEKGIRVDISQRTTPLLQKVFAKQDGK